MPVDRPKHHVADRLAIMPAAPVYDTVARRAMLPSAVEAAMAHAAPRSTVATVLPCPTTTGDAADDVCMANGVVGVVLEADDLGVVVAAALAFFAAWGGVAMLVVASGVAVCSDEAGPRAAVVEL